MTEKHWNCSCIYGFSTEHLIVLSRLLPRILVTSIVKHKPHKTATLGARTFSCAVSGLGLVSIYALCKKRPSQ